MTTFTRLSDQDTPVISVHPTRRISKINPNIYAGFTEYAAVIRSFLMNPAID